MDVQKIKALIELAAVGRLSYLEYEEDGCRLRVGRGETSTPSESARPAASSAPAVNAGGEADASPIADLPVETTVGDGIVTAPMFGLFYPAAEPGGPSFVLVGDAVRKGQKLCVLEAMKAFHVVEAKRDGVVRAVFAESGQEVDAGQPLFRIE